MGHKEDLLAGAKRCLYERGYARTTARDIVAASGTNLASIGYHFGSKEALLKAAMIEAIDDWGKEIGRALAADVDPTATSLERFEAIWNRMLDSFAEHRQLWVATFEVFTQIDHVPEVRVFLADALEQGRSGLAQLFQNIDPAAEGQAVRAIGSFYQALMTGVMTQWMIDPERAPSGHDLAQALRVIAASDRSPESADDNAS
jgi:AcrR family transcriptional regulator